MRKTLINEQLDLKSCSLNEWTPSRSSVSPLVWCLPKISRDLKIAARVEVRYQNVLSRKFLEACEMLGISPAISLRKFTHTHTHTFKSKV